MATIKIRRPGQVGGSLAVHTVLLDGEWAGKLLDDDQLALQMDAGTHSLQLKINWCRSDIVSFSITEDGSLTFEGGTSRGMFSLFLFFFRPSRYLWLRKIAAT
jgi:hypothetical protein